jgi:hypothetical protein
MDIRKLEIDERLLVFLPYYKQLFLRNHPGLRAGLTDKIARKALLKALEASGAAKRVRQPDGRVRLEPTEDYLRDSSTQH